MKFHISAAAGQKNGQFNRKTNQADLDFKIGLIC